MKPVERVLADAKMGKSDVDEVVLVGGSTRIPKIQEMIKQFFNVRHTALQRDTHATCNTAREVKIGAQVPCQRPCSHSSPLLSFALCYRLCVGQGALQDDQSG